MRSISRRRKSRRPPCWKRLVRKVVALGIVLVVAPAWGSGTTYKNYIVRTDRGWDIMCEPYVVQEGDWVYKLFRQKGEIAHADFQEFLGIFGRLNPHVHNLDLLRPGQTIDIPLQKLERGTLPGQDSGMVTIPVVTLSRLDELAAHTFQSYEVQKGDTVSRLIAARFGRYGSIAYNDGIARFEAANAQVDDLDRIFIGQKVMLPKPAVHRQAWSESAQALAGQQSERPSVEQRTAETVQLPKQAARPSSPPVGGAAAKAHAPSDAEMIAGRDFRGENVLAEAAAIVGAVLRDKGTYNVPRTGAPDFEIDLSLHALMEMDDGARLVFTQGDTVMGTDPAALRVFWPDAAVVDYLPTATVQEVVDAIFAALDKKEGAPESAPAGGQVAFEGRGVQAVVRAKWVRPQTDQKKICITPIETPPEQTPAALVDYLRQHGIVLREILPGQAVAAVQAVEPQEGRHAIRNVLHLAPVDHKDLVKKLASALGLSYSPHVAIEFFYAEIQIQAYVDLIKAPNGSELLLDFGDLHGETVDAIRKSGPQVVQVDAAASSTTVVRTILSELGLNFEEDPHFLGAARSARYNSEFTISGFLYKQEPDRKILLTEAQLPQAITELVTADGTQIIEW